jgi:hypothetical protein
LANITTPRVTAERVGDEIFLAVLLSDTAAPARATVLELHHPTLLHVPASLAAMFDDEEPIKARVERFHVRISGTLADGE